jgi:threonine dehydratase
MSGETAGMITRVAVDAAYGRIRSHIRRTPVMEYDDVVLKLELFQHSGSFKARGSFNSALAQGVPEAGLIALSGGNHGIAVAHVARELGVRAEIFVPSYAAPTKLDRIRALGAVVDAGNDLFVDAAEACARRAEETGALAIHPFDAPLTVAGQGTVGIEIEQQVGDVDTIVVAVGGGGLAAGIAAALPDVRIVGVEPQGAATFHAAVAAGRPVDITIDSIAADSLGAPRLGTIPWEQLADRIELVTVTDADIVAARQHLWDDLQLVTEHGGATAHAALHAGRWTPDPGERTVVVVCGANTDPADLTTGRGHPIR